MTVGGTSLPDPAGIVRAFCAAMSQCSAPDAGAYLAEHVRYHNIPLEPVLGRDAVQAELSRQFASYETVEFRIDHLAADDDVVLTERTDLLGRGGQVIEMPVMGVFEISNGLIDAWRDYFDLGQFRALTATAAGTAAHE